MPRATPTTTTAPANKPTTERSASETAATQTAHKEVGTERAERLLQITTAAEPKNNVTARALASPRLGAVNAPKFPNTRTLVAMVAGVNAANAHNDRPARRLDET